jgi:enoyl-CoA hydratase
MSHASEVVVVTRSSATMTVRINRPEVFNALNGEVVRGIGLAVEQAAASPAIRVVILTGTGDKAFSAGADLKELRDLDPDRAQDVMRVGQTVMRQIERAPVPVIAAVNGVALGGGFELALASTFCVLSARASLGLPESGLGLIPGYGGTQRLPRRIGAPAAAHLMLTGARMDAERAYQLGLSPLPPVEAAELMDTVSALAARIAAQGPLAVRAILGALEDGRDAPLDTALALETALAALALTGRESAEGIPAFLERRPARFPDPPALPEPGPRQAG